MRRLTLALLACLSACGEDDTTPIVVPLPKAPRIIPDELVYTFELTAAGQTSVVSIPIVNKGQDPLVISSTTVTSGSNVFTVTPPASSSIASREADVINVTFHPQSRGVYVAELVIVSNAGDFPTLTLQLVGPARTPGGGVDLPDIAAFETTVLPVQLGSATQATTFARFINLGTGPLAVFHYNLTGSDAFAIRSGVLQPGAACSVSTPCAQPLYCADDGAADVCSLEVPTGGFVVLPIIYAPKDTATSHSATVHILTDDNDTPNLSIVVQGQR